METSNGDDLGSGWLEVKKKHRSSSRFPLQRWVIGSSGKQSFQGSQSAQIKDGNSLMKHRPNIQKPRVVLNAQSQQSPLSSTRNEKEGADVVCVSDARDINFDSLLSKETICTFQEDRSIEVPQKLKCDVRHKIKWGDLDDELMLKHGRKVNDESTLCGTDQDDVMVCTTPGINEYHVSDDSSGKLVDSATGEHANLFSHGNSHSESMEIKFTVTSEDANTQQFPAPEDEVSRKRVQELKEVFSTDTNEPPGPQKFDQSDNGLYGIQNHPEPIKRVSGNFSVPECSSIEVTETVQLSVSKNCMVCTSPMPHESIAEIDSSQESKLPGESSGLDIHREPQTTSSLEKAETTMDSALQMDVSKTVLTNSTGEGTASESKERFRQRLWCFLFENLNRAIDELYLLCELECDVQQMKEAIIVLEEAASDFKELNSRVQDFESPKRPSSEVVDGLSLALMSDHRRPHALSWEVRRMTTSLHRAEILSSSLEAFKKIQKERNASYLTNQMTEVGPSYYAVPKNSNCIPRSSEERSGNGLDSKESTDESKTEMGGSNPSKVTLTADRKYVDRGKTCNVNPAQTMHLPSKASSLSNPSASKSVSVSGKCRGLHGSRELELSRKDKALAENMAEKTSRVLDQSKVNNFSDKERERRFSTSSKNMDAWKEKRNWGDILSSPFRGSSRASYNPGMSRKSAERARVLHDKLMSPDKRKKTTTDLKKEAEEKHARALRIRSELETERVQKLQRSSEKFNRVNEWQADRSTKLREVLHARHQRSVSRHEAHLAQVVRRAGDESSKVNEVRFITSLNEENKKLVLRQKLHDSEIRRAEKLQVIKIKQKEDMAREEAVLERRKILEAEKLQRLAEMQRKKEEAQIRREEERIASNAAREAKAIEQQRKKEIRAKVQQEESELLAQKLAERLAESEQRRKVYLEQIRERASMDFRDQSSPFMRRSHNKDNQGRSTPTTNLEDCQSNIVSHEGKSTLVDGNIAFQSSMKRRIKKIRQRLMALKHEIPEPLWNNENIGIGYRTTVGIVRAKIGRSLQELQRLRQARKGAGAIGLIISEIIKYVEGKELELHACRQAGLLDFIASALPASHSSKPDACLVTVYFLRLLKVVLSLPSNRSYFLAQNLLPPIIPMLAAVVETYTKIAASVNAPGCTTPLSSRTSVESLDSTSEILDSFLLIVTLVIGFSGSDESQLQMQDELVELVTAYQVIHRLRDLFALYDRPQVEGSPFPSSIILSINLLNVLTSRCAPTSSTDLDISSFELVADHNCRPQLAAFDESSTSLVGDFVGDHRPSSLVATSTTVITVSGVAEDRSAEEDMKFMDNDESGLENKDTESGPPVYGAEKNVDTLKITELQKDMADSTIPAAGQNIDKISKLKPPTAFLLSVISENGLVSLPSLLTAVLLQANSKQSSEQNSYVLPSNFEEVATGVLKVFNNLALIDITFLQKMLSRPDLKMEFFHIMSFLLSHCTSKWKVATDQVGLLLIESLSLLGYFALSHPGNQAVLRWGKSPTILHKVCDLPFVFFSDPKLMPVLAGTLIASCYGCEQNKVVVQLELSVDMVVSLLRACKNDLLEPQGHASSTVKHVTDDSQIFQVDSSLRSSRSGTKSSRLSLGKSGALGRTGKARNQKEGKAFRSSEDMSQKQKSPLWETCSPMMLHRRFPDSFLEKAEQFFSVDCSQD